MDLREKPTFAPYLRIVKHISMNTILRKSIWSMYISFKNNFNVSMNMGEQIKINKDEYRWINKNKERN